MGDVAGEDEIKECFEIFDKDSSGTISKAQVGTAVRALGKNPTNEDLARLLDGQPDQIDLATFSALYNSEEFKTASAQEEPMLAAFAALDRDGKGKIDAAQLRQILTTLGDVLTGDETETLFKEVTEGADGIDYKDFVATLVNSYSLKDRPPPFK